MQHTLYFFCLLSLPSKDLFFNWFSVELMIFRNTPHPFIHSLTQFSHPSPQPLFSPRFEYRNHRGQTWHPSHNKRWLPKPRVSTPLVPSCLPDTIHSPSFSLIHPTIPSFIPSTLHPSIPRPSIHLSYITFAHVHQIFTINYCKSISVSEYHLWSTLRH